MSKRKLLIALFLMTLALAAIELRVSQSLLGANSLSQPKVLAGPVIPPVMPPPW